MCGVKNALLLQLPFQLLKSRSLSACALGDNIVHIELIGSVALVDSYTSRNYNSHTVLGGKLQTSCRICKHHCLYGALTVLQGEVHMAAAEMLHIVGYLSADHDALNVPVIFQYRADISVYLCNCDYRHRFSPVLLR